MPPELVAIISHLALQQTPWWSDAVDSVILTALFKSANDLTENEIRESISREYGADLMPGTINNALGNLESRFRIVKLPNGKYRTTRDAAELVKGAIAQWESVRSAARTIFIGLLPPELPETTHDLIWEQFQAEVLVPAIIDLGAQAWNFFANSEPVFADSIEPYLRHFLKKFPEELRNRLRDAVFLFLDPNVDASRSFIVDTLSACFFTTACGLSRNEVEHIEKILANPFEIRALLDIDLILAMNGLFDSNTNELVQSLLQLQGSERLHAFLEFLVSTMTLNEARTALRFAARLTQVESDEEMTLEGPLSMSIQGIMASYIGSGDVDYQAYFEGWASALDRGSSVGLIPVGSDLFDDATVMSDARAYKRMSVRAELSSSEGASDRRYMHDVALRSIVKKLRGGEWPDLFQNKHWLVTSNNFLLRYDAYTAKRTGTFPVCVSPLTLLQMLRLWIPRSDAWDRAALSSMRLPFVNLGDTGKLDHAALQVLRALAQHGRFAVDDERLLAALINEELRRTVSSASRKFTSEGVEQRASQRELQEIKEDLRVVQDENKALRASLQEAQERAERRKFATRMFAVAGSFSALLAIFITLFLKDNFKPFSSILMSSIVGACIAGVATLGAAWLYVAAAKDEIAKGWRGRLKRWMASFVVVVIVNLCIGALASAVYDAFKGH
jgi:hypothetical protein